MKQLVVPLLVVLLAGCSDNLPVSSSIYTKPTMAVPTIQPTQQLPVEWYIITKENLQTKLQEIEQKQGSSTIFAISAQGYQNLSINVADLRRYITQQQAVITALREYYETPQEQKNEQAERK